VDTQQILLKRFKRLFPTHSYKEISMLTGIQITRVFRLFNGAEMKISEYRAFENLLSFDRQSLWIKKISKMDFDILSSKDQDEIENYINRKISWIQFNDRSEKVS